MSSAPVPPGSGRSGTALSAMAIMGRMVEADCTIDEFDNSDLEIRNTIRWDNQWTAARIGVDTDEHEYDWFLSVTPQTTGLEDFLTGNLARFNGTNRVKISICQKKFDLRVDGYGTIFVEAPGGRQFILPEVGPARRNRTTADNASLSTGSTNIGPTNENSENVSSENATASASNTQTQEPVLCSICMGDIEAGSHVLDCKHEFHLKCLFRWAGAQKTLNPVCPLCRAPMAATDEE